MAHGTAPPPRPSLLLLVLTPFVAEFLLGDFSVRSLGLLLVFVPMYGGEALLIREVVRRTHWGWPSIVPLAVAYALVEEASPPSRCSIPTTPRAPSWKVENP